MVSIKNDYKNSRLEIWVDGSKKKKTMVKECVGEAFEIKTLVLGRLSLRGRQASKQRRYVSSTLQHGNINLDVVGIKAVVSPIEKLR